MTTAEAELKAEQAEYEAEVARRSQETAERWASRRAAAKTDPMKTDQGFHTLWLGVTVDAEDVERVAFLMDTLRRGIGESNNSNDETISADWWGPFEPEPIDRYVLEAIADHHTDRDEWEEDGTGWYPAGRSVRKLSRRAVEDVLSSAMPKEWERINQGVS